LWNLLFIKITEQFCLELDLLLYPINSGESKEIIIRSACFSQDSNRYRVNRLQLLDDINGLRFMFRYLYVLNSLLDMIGGMSFYRFIPNSKLGRYGTICRPIRYSSLNFSAFWM